jgi:hypothetical protein
MIQVRLVGTPRGEVFDLNHLQYAFQTSVKLTICVPTSAKKESNELWVATRQALHRFSTKSRQMCTELMLLINLGGRTQHWREY